MSIIYDTKAFMVRRLRRLGYNIERKLPEFPSNLDIFELALRSTGIFENCLFLQIGANDGISDDPIRNFILARHWSGLLLEPQIGPFNDLVSNYNGVKGLTFLNAALTETDGPVEFFSAEGNDLLGGLSAASLHRRIANKSNIKSFTVKGISAQTLISGNSLQNIDLLQVDVEGYDAQAIKLIFSTGVRPAVVRFEHVNLNRNELEQTIHMLANCGYEMLRLGIDILCVKVSRKIAA
jgi:FkbM family methyltransferase